MTNSQVLWWVIIDRQAEELWRASVGQADIDSWCAAHGWDAKKIRSGSVMVSALKATDRLPARVEVMAEEFEEDADGNRFRRGDDVATRLVWADYRRPLPEGIAPVQRAS